MARGISTGTSNSAGYYLRNFYSENRDASKSSKRGDLSNAQLIIEDSTALRKASSKLSSYEKTDDSIENDDDIMNTVKAYIDVYNNATESSGKSDSPTMKRYAKRLSELTDKYSEELDEIGITVDKEGKMKVNENLLKAAGKEKIKEVFGTDVGYTRDLRSLSRRINKEATDIMYTELTGNGGNINYTL